MKIRGAVLYNRIPLFYFAYSTTILTNAAMTSERKIYKSQSLTLENPPAVGKPDSSAKVRTE